ncbi:subtilisin-like protease SBT4.15 [Citrus clementina]|uniref:subtilisin-like protease SBT4.15 n=1 Tax=Citrus clementina TaxID=85681 RepID=UPI000CED42AB|nr:subtilisin-like protease SBT4.15 [Citrus x clementina]
MKVIPNLLVFFFDLFLAIILVNGSTSDRERKPYIVYMGNVPEEAGISAVKEHHSLLTTAIGDEKLARESKIHSYGKSFNGFVARLLPHEAKRLSEEESVVSVFENTRRKLHTTRTWDFLGMSEKLQKRNSKAQSNIIVGLLDTGIWVESPSFNDKGFGPPPAKWKGKCVTGANFTRCNKKVIGARYYNLDNALDTNTDQKSPVDTDGHGTHTSSTAAGETVKGSSLYGIAQGTARGGVPSARIAMYKVCWSGGCADMDILAAFDDAIGDGVDLISISIGGPSRSYFDDSISIGSFHAMKKGILTACSAGNDGPYQGTVENVAPWIMTVAASSIDRKFVTAVKLGNGMRTSGISINTFSPRKAMYPLTNGARAANVTAEIYGNVSACDYGTLSMKKVKGKIVYCLGSGSQDYTIDHLQGAGTIMAVDAPTDIAIATLIAGTFVVPEVGIKIDQYINSTKNPQAVIYKTRVVNTSTAPFIASFSSRGPQKITLNILKPDIAAPGLDILAAYSELASVTGLPGDRRIVPFNILSGTSMACPHAAAAAAYVKSFHPDWSPAAIKSALMTTATPMKTKSDDAELASGSGQINPTKAVHPGLIYDLNLSSYTRFLCKEGYNSTAIGRLIGRKKKLNCSTIRPAQGLDGLNYPSMHFHLTNESSISAIFRRTVTNVGFAKSLYKATVHSPKGLSVTVSPRVLTFSRSHQTRSFTVLVKGSMQSGASILSALLEWSDTKHSVKSPILVYKQFPPLF